MQDALTKLRKNIIEVEKELEDRIHHSQIRYGTLNKSIITFADGTIERFVPKEQTNWLPHRDSI